MNIIKEAINRNCSDYVRKANAQYIFLFSKGKQGPNCIISGKTAQHRLEDSKGILSQFKDFKFPQSGEITF